MARGEQFIILNMKIEGNQAVLWVRDYASEEEYELVVKDFTNIFGGVVDDLKGSTGRGLQVMGIRDRISLLPPR